MRKHRAFGSAAAAAALLAFALAQPARAAEPEGPAEVIHWMVGTSEAKALKGAIETFTAEGGTWVDAGTSPGDVSRQLSAQRVVAGDPPTAMMFVSKLQIRDMLDAGLIGDVTDVATADKWSELLPPVVMEALSFDGQVFATPIDFQMINVFWYNKEVFAKAGLEPPKSWDDILPIFEKLKAAGVVPLAIAAENPQWRNLFNAVLGGVGGPALYNRIYIDRDEAAVRSPEFRKVAETFKALKQYADAAGAARKWNESTAMVITGKAGVQILGTWVKGEWKAAGKTPEKDFGCALPGAPIVNTAMFVFPKVDDPLQVAAQRHIARVFMDPKVQSAFSAIKGGLPPRPDADVSGYDLCGQAFVQAMRANPKDIMLDSQVLLDPTRMGGLVDLVIQYWGDSFTTDEFIDKFAQRLVSDV